MEQDVYAAGQQDFNLPHDIIELPSRGLFYKSKKKSIKVGYLTAVDENIIAEADFKKSIQESIILPLLRNKIYERDIKPEELIDGDVEAILLFLRNTSFGPEYTISLVDSATNQSFTTNILLDELNYKETPVKPNEEGLFEVQLPVSKNNVVLKILTFGEKVEIEKIVQSYPAGRVAPSVTTRLFYHIISINGDSDKAKISTIIEKMPIADSKFIRKFIMENEPRLDLRKEVIAPSGEKVMADITFGVEFFRPFISI
jgi:hypothetical protein